MFTCMRAYIKSAKFFLNSVLFFTMMVWLIFIVDIRPPMFEILYTDAVVRVLDVLKDKIVPHFFMIIITIASGFIAFLAFGVCTGNFSNYDKAEAALEPSIASSGSLLALTIFTWLLVIAALGSIVWFLIWFILFG